MEVQYCRIYLKQELDNINKIKSALVKNNPVAIENIVNGTLKVADKSMIQKTYTYLESMLILTDLISEVRNDPNYDDSTKSEIINNLQKVKTRLKQALSLKQQKVVSTGQLLRNFNESGLLSARETQLYFSMDFFRPSALIPGLSAQLNSRIFRELRSEFVALTFFDGKNIVATQDDLNDALAGYKRNLVSNIINYLRKNNVSLCINPKYPLLNPNSPYDIDLLLQSEKRFKELYEQTLKAAWEAIEIEIQKGGVTYLDVVDSPTNLPIINLVKNFYILLNFDDCVSNFTGGSITFDHNYKDYIDIVPNKYIFKKQLNKVGSFQDMYNDIDDSESTSLSLKMFIASIKKEDGELLKPDFLQRLVLAIKNACENEGIAVAEKFDFIFSDDSAEIKLGELINCLLGQYAVSEVLDMIKNPSEIKAFVSSLTNYRDALDSYKKLKNKGNWKENQDFENNANILSALFDALRNKQAMTYSSSMEDGTLEIKSSIAHSKSKITLRNSIQNLLIERLSSGEYYYYSDEFAVTSDETFETLTSIDSPRVQDLLYKATGINFSDPRIYKLFSTPSGLETLRNFLKALNEAVTDNAGNYSVHLSAVKTSVAKIMAQLVSGKDRGAFKEFSDLYVSENSTTAEKLQNEDGDTVPIEGTNNTISNLRGNMLKAQELLGSEITQTNILWATGNDRKGIIQKSSEIEKGGFATHIVNSLETIINGRVHRPTDLSVSELATVAIGTDYLDGIVRRGHMLTQLECFSDKVRIAKGAWNLRHLPLHTWGIDQILYRAYKQHKGYYDLVSKKIITDLTELFSSMNEEGWKTPKDLFEWAKYLENWSANLLNNRDPEYSDESDEEYIEHKFARIVAAYQKSSGKNLSLYRDVHFTIKDSQLSINSVLLYKVAQANDEKLFKEAHQTGFETFLKNIQNPKYRPKLAITFTEDELKSPELLALFTSGKKGENITSEDIANFFNGNDNLFDLSTGNVELKMNFLRKYFELFNLTRDADLEVSLKHMWIHDKDHSTLFGLTQEDFKDKNVIKAILKEEGDRLTKGKKRMNAGPATFSSWAQGQYYGVPKLFRIATIEHAVLRSFNHFGNLEWLNTHDGAIFSPTVTRVLERGSYPGHNVASSLKVIAINQQGPAQELVKCADYEMSNAWIRRSMQHDLRQNVEDFDGRLLMYKMLGFTELGQTFIDNWIKDNGSLGKRRLFLTIGEYRSQLDTTVNQDGTITLTFKDEIADKVVRTTTLSAKSTLYNLWQALGGELVKEENEKTGELEYSDASLEITAYMMSEYDPSLKEKYIAKLIDEEASKSSQAPKNAKKEFYNPNSTLAYVMLDTSCYGIQQDYSHHADGSTIPALTQVITAIAFNGENTKLVQLCYEILASITENALNKFTDAWNSKEKIDFLELMAKELLHQLKTNSLSSSAELLVKNAINNIGRLKTLPFSNQQLFYLATSNLTVNLNHKTIRQTFPGIAVVQNPANGIIGIYEDNKGITYSRTELIELANKKWSEVKPDNVELDQDAIVSLFLLTDDRFKNYPVSSAAELKIGEYIQISKEEYFKLAPYLQSMIVEYGKKENTSVLKSLQKCGGIRKDEFGNYVLYVENPFVLYALHEAKVTNIIKRRDIQRDLATTQITWTNEDNTLGNFWLLPSTMEAVKVGINPKEDPFYKLQVMRWHQNNLKLLRNEGTYYKSLDDFLKGDESKKVHVSNVTHRGGEEILPKQYKTALGLKHSYSYIKNAGWRYFLDTVDERFKLNDSILLLKNEIGIASQDYDVVLTTRTAEGINTIVHSDGTVTDPYGVEIEGLKVNPGDKVAFKRESDKSKPTVIVYTRDLTNKSKREISKYVKKGYANSYNVGKDTENQKFKNRVLSLNSSVAVKRNNDGNITELDFEGSREVLALQIYNSWELTCETISARIPSQAYLSFLPNVTVGYTEDESNNGYMNIWEMWFLGSDYDIK